MTVPARVTIHDVAREAGVSVATVSKVINGRYGVSQATSSRVKTVIDTLGYESSLVARSLRSHRTNVIGILVAEFEPFSAEILKGTSSAIAGTGYELLAYSGGGGSRPGWEHRYLSRLAGTLIDGAILVTPTVVTAEISIPVIAIDPHLGPSGLPTIDADNMTGARSAVQHLLDLGHRRIALIGGRADLESARLREVGYRAALQSAGIEPDPSLILTGDYRRATAIAPALELLGLPDRPTAVFAANDLSALGVMEAARSLGLDVPRDLSVVGFDNIPESALSNPPLTTVSQPLQQMGATAIEMLVDLIQGRPAEVTHVRMPTQLVVRGSTRRR